MLSQIELLRRVSHAVTQSPDKWNDEMKETVSKVFSVHKDVKIAYAISQNFKRWYACEHGIKSAEKIKNRLHEWYGQASIIPEFKAVVKMIKKHEEGIINFFRLGLTNAKAENLNGKLQRFITGNYGIKALLSDKKSGLKK